MIKTPGRKGGGVDTAIQRQKKRSVLLVILITRPYFAWEVSCVGKILVPDKHYFVPASAYLSWVCDPATQIRVRIVLQQKKLIVISYGDNLDLNQSWS
jgi:hypothetical protein